MVPPFLISLIIACVIDAKVFARCLAVVRLWALTEYLNSVFFTMGLISFGIEYLKK